MAYSRHTRIQVNERVELAVLQGGTSLFSIKGLKEGPTLLFDDHAPFIDVVAAVEEELTRANGFFRGSPVVLHFGDRLLQKEEWWHLKEALHREEVLLRYVVSNNAASRKMLYKEGLSVRESIPSPQSPQSPQSPRLPQEQKTDQDTIPPEGQRASYLRHGLRGGQKKVFDRDVILAGDVNQGAEIIAGGDVVVIGTLRGIVHAGYPDNERAVVIALNLTPLQLRIGALIAIPEEGQNHRGVLHPEVARVLDEQIVIEPYNGKL